MKSKKRAIEIKPGEQGKGFNVHIYADIYYGLRNWVNYKRVNLYVQRWSYFINK